MLASSGQIAYILCWTDRAIPHILQMFSKCLIINKSFSFYISWNIWKNDLCNDFKKASMHKFALYSTLKIAV